MLLAEEIEITLGSLGGEGYLVTVVRTPSAAPGTISSYPKAASIFMVKGVRIWVILVS